MKVCEYDKMRTYYLYDGVKRSCEKVKSCDPIPQNENLFESLKQCRSICASPHLVKRQECLTDWGDPYVDRDVKGDYQIAFNKNLAMCDIYVKHEGSDPPPLFKTRDECKLYCLINPPS
ncbi:hypothetical protein RF11_00269 [Thelohanellus kitauei]|uniref:BPTI/Kunitz inhibitor domain-containing protein n=1 Tax=Thelohanellus kitauei TaxID=669202 RepID=A0A0C2N7N3_THEKT|nr:hypothetical protein RF11_00269 [Thelohanellus kitauei]